MSLKIVFFNLIIICFLTSNIIAETDKIVVLSYNIKNNFGFVAPGSSWELRKNGLLPNVIQPNNPDIIGFQEVFDTDSEGNTPKSDLVNMLNNIGYNNYTCNSTSTDYNQIFYKSNRFDLIKKGVFWFSETPNVWESTWLSNDMWASLASWIILHDKQTLKRYFILNTHITERGIGYSDIHFIQDVNVIRDEIDRLSENYPIILLGDYNSTWNDDVMTLIYGENTSKTLYNSYYSSPTFDPNISYYTSFEFSAEPKDKISYGSEDKQIDHVLHSEDFSILSYLVDFNAIYYYNNGLNNVTVSDHWPVVVEMTNDKGLYKKSTELSQKEVIVPAHEGSQSIRMSATEVTVLEYDQLMNPVWTIEEWGVQPVSMITYCDAIRFCNEKSKANGLDTVYSYTGKYSVENFHTYQLYDLATDFTKNGYRLPTKSEWEFAYLGGTKSSDNSGLYWPNHPDSISTLYAHYNKEDKQPVGLLRPNKYGLYDMAGNVAEWVEEENGFHYKMNSCYLDEIALLAYNDIHWTTTGSPTETGMHMGFRVVRKAPDMTPIINLLLN